MVPEKVLVETEATATEESAIEKADVSESNISTSEELEETLKEETSDGSNVEAKEETEEVLEKETEEVIETKKDDVETSESKVTHRETVGWVERIQILPENLSFNAKLTPGSEGNVFHAKDVKKFKKKGKSWVRFEVTGRKGKKATLEREVVSKTKIRNTKGIVTERVEVKLGVCIAETYIELDFGLADRSDFSHEVRIGREALAGNFLIDPSLEKTKKPNCK